MQTSGDERREIAKLYPLVIASAAKIPWGVDSDRV
jgi:hypothetical protein